MKARLVEMKTRLNLTAEQEEQLKPLLQEEIEKILTEAQMAEIRAERQEGLRKEFEERRGSSG